MRKAVQNNQGLPLRQIKGTATGLPAVANRPGATIQRTAATDLAEALQNFNYLQAEMNRAHASAIAVHTAYTNEPAGATKDNAASGFLDFSLKYIDQVDARNTELFEVERLLNKIGAKRRVAIMSANDNTDADISYINSRGQTTVKEIKTVNSANVGTVTSRIVSADGQLGNRVAETRKILVNIANVNNRWPGVHAYGNIHTDQQFRATVRGAMPDLANADKVAINGVQVNTIRGGPGALDIKMKVYGNGKVHSVTF